MSYACVMGAQSDLSPFSLDSKEKSEPRAFVVSILNFIQLAKKPCPKANIQVHVHVLYNWLTLSQISWHGLSDTSSVVWISANELLTALYPDKLPLFKEVSVYFQPCLIISQHNCNWMDFSAFGGMTENKPWRNLLNFAVALNEEADLGIGLSLYWNSFEFVNDWTGHNLVLTDWLALWLGVIGYMARWLSG